MLQHWIAILALAALAAVLLSVLVIGPRYPNLFAVMFVIAMAGLGFAVMTLQVAEYRAANPPGDAFGPVTATEREVLQRSPNSLLPVRPGIGAAAPPAARNPYIAESRQPR